MALSRRREYLADASAAAILNDPEAMALALRRLQLDTSEVVYADRATAHLFIESPTRAIRGSGAFLAGLFQTHPSLESRIETLEEAGGFQLPPLPPGAPEELAERRHDDRGGDDGRQGGLHERGVGGAAARRGGSGHARLGGAPGVHGNLRRGEGDRVDLGKHRDSPSELVRELAGSHGTGFGIVASPKEVQGTIDALAGAVATLTQKAPDEVEPYRALVLDVANAAAGAKGGVAPEETAAIEQVKAALGAA